MHKTLTLDDIDFSGKTVLMRVDFNVPLQNGAVSDDTRIRRALPSIEKILSSGGRLVLMSHLGRPKGQRQEKFSLKPAAARLSELVGQNVPLAPDCIGAETEKMVAALNNGELLLLENLRFHAGETANDPDFAKALAAHGEIYVNDAFGAAHRAHASTVGVTQYIDTCAAGYLMAAELQALGKLISDAEKPYVAILGGAKISDKIEVIRNLLPRVTHILIGGAMAYTLLRSKGIAVGTSLVEEEKLDVAAEALKSAAEQGVSLLVPEDHVVAAEFDSDSGEITEGAAIPEGRMGLDIGPKTVQTYGELIAGARTIFWNGPMGVFENPAFAKGTLEIARAVAEATDKGAFSVVGGGDSVSALKKSGMTERISHVSTGGGASLEFMSGKELPGVAALQQ